jgi:hypothetical protein
MAKKSLKIKFFFFSLSPKKINRQNKATTYKAQWTTLLGLCNPINPVKATKFALKFIYFLSIHCRFQEKGVINGVVDECVCVGACVQSTN